MHIGQQVRVRDGIHAHAGRTGTIHEPAHRGWFVVFDAPILPGSAADMASFSACQPACSCTEPAHQPPANTAATTAARIQFFIPHPN